MCKLPDDFYDRVKELVRKENKIHWYHVFSMAEQNKMLPPCYAIIRGDKGVFTIKMLAHVQVEW
jgi:hypothetical protein